MKVFMRVLLAMLALGVFNVVVDLGELRRPIAVLTVLVAVPVFLLSTVAGRWAR